MLYLLVEFSLLYKICALLPARKYAGVDLGPLPYICRNLQVSLHMGPLTSGVGGVLVSVSCHWILFLLHGLPGWASVKEDVSSLARTRCPRTGWNSRGLLFSEKGRGMGETSAEVGLGREERWEHNLCPGKKTITIFIIDDILDLTLFPSTSFFFHFIGIILKYSGRCFKVLLKHVQLWGSFILSTIYFCLLPHSHLTFFLSISQFWTGKWDFKCDAQQPPLWFNLPHEYSGFLYPITSYDMFSDIWM